MPSDAVRFQWSHMPVWIQVVGAIILISSLCLFYLVIRENPYLSPAVRIQKDRGQTVVSTGPYHYIRHPYYSASILFFLGTILLLDSWYGLIPGLVLTALVVIHAGRKDATDGTQWLWHLHETSEIYVHSAYMVAKKTCISSLLSYVLNIPANWIDVFLRKKKLLEDF